jgi:hypothetical protein
MTQTVWHRDDIARIAATLIAMAPSDEFAAGVMALAQAVGAQAKAPRRPLPVDVLIEGEYDES